jgi:hypothetical protein
VTAAVLAALAGVATQTSAKPAKAAAEPAYGATLVCPAGTSDPNYCTGSTGNSSPGGTGPSGFSSPVFDSSANVVPLAGTILVELPGTDVFVLLPEGETIPFGSIIDARRGRVEITVTLPNGTTETGVFYDGEFKFTQSASGRVFLTLTGGSFAGCPSSTTHGPRSEATSASKKKKPKTVVRQLWGSAHGDFTTKGRYGSAAVSGTIWLTRDLCEGTYFKVTKDTIVVTAFAFPHKHHHLKQGQSFVVFAPGF